MHFFSNDDARQVSLYEEMECPYDKVGTSVVKTRVRLSEEGYGKEREPYHVWCAIPIIK